MECVAPHLAAIVTCRGARQCAPAPGRLTPTSPSGHPGRIAIRPYTIGTAAVE